ncbi:MAG: YqaA family protein [Candidatus Eiseniibacteriota bacterium]
MNDRASKTAGGPASTVVPGERSGSAAPAPPASWLRRLYDWVLHWAETPYGVPALAVLAFAESSFFPVPPDVLLIALGISIPRRALRYALVCTVASVVGGMLGYAIGHYGYGLVGARIVDFYHGAPVMEQVRVWYDQYGFLGVLIAAVTPIPYKVFTIASGVFDFHFGTFLAASVIGRSLRFFAVAGLIRVFGAPIKSFIDRYFNLLAILFVVLLVAGFAAVKLLGGH